MTQAALLLDQMEDAEKFIGKMVQYCYLPRWGKWLSPEGIIVHREGALLSFGERLPGAG